jgi:CRP-like cAMP-binding protein
MQALLQNVPILAGMDEAALEFLCQRGSESQAPAGTVILTEGDAGNRFFVIRAGSVRVCKRFNQPDELELARLGAGDFFGEMCILETLPRSATVQALTETQLFSVTSLTFYQLYKTIPSQYSILVLNIARDLSRRLRHVDEEFAARH